MDKKAKYREKQKITDKLYRLRNAERLRKASSEWYLSNKNTEAFKNKRTVELSRKTRIKNRYNLSIEKFDEMIKKQNNKCAICNQPEFKIRYGKIQSLAIDHDHLTGKIRGLLCNNCNRAIGLMHDSIETLKNAVAYLEQRK